MSKDSQCEQSQLWFVKGKGLPVWRGLGARATISGSRSTHNTQRVGYVKAYGEDRLEMSLRGLPLEKRDEIYAKLKDLLAGT